MSQQILASVLCLINKVSHGREFKTGKTLSVLLTSKIVFSWPFNQCLYTSLKETEHCSHLLVLKAVSEVLLNYHSVSAVFQIGKAPHNEPQQITKNGLDALCFPTFLSSEVKKSLKCLFNCLIKSVPLNPRVALEGVHKAVTSFPLG